MSAQADPIGSPWYRLPSSGSRAARTNPKIVEYRQPKWSVTPTNVTILSDRNVISGTSFDSAITVEDSERSGALNAIATDPADNPLLTIVASINGLMKASDEENEVVATEHAYSTARATIESAYGRLLDQKKAVISKVPAPAVTTDDRGGVRLSWRSGEKQVRVNFGAFPEARSYLYFESPLEHNVDDLQPTNLSQRLEWLLTP
jgi:hypothetical protein